MDMPDLPDEFSKAGVRLHLFDEKGPESWADTSLIEPDRQLLEKNKKLRDAFLAEQLSQRGVKTTDKHVVIKENEFFLNDETLFPIEDPEEVPGHPDVLIYFPDHKLAFIFDSKFGGNPVPKAYINLQLRCYAVMVSDEYECQTIIAAITQPRLNDPEDFHAVLFEADEMEALRLELLGVIKSCTLPDAPRIPSAVACMHCKAKASCQEAVGVLAEVAAMTVKNITVDQLEEIYIQYRLRAKGVIDAMENRMRYLGERGLLKRHRLGRQTVCKEISDSRSAFDMLYKAGGILHSDLNEAATEWNSVSKVSRSQLERLLARNRGVTEAVMKKKVMSTLGDLIDEKTNRPPIERLEDE